MLAGVLAEETSHFVQHKINIYHAKVCSMCLIWHQSLNFF